MVKARFDSRQLRREEGGTTSNIQWYHHVIESVVGSLIVDRTLSFTINHIALRSPRAPQVIVLLVLLKVNNTSHWHGLVKEGVVRGL